MFYLYRHIRLDKNEVFYIGIGKIPHNAINTVKSTYRRAFEKTKSRSLHWKNITALTSYEVEIIFETDSETFIQEKEVEFIALYKPTLCNQTEGGYGIEGYNHTEECKQRIRNTLTGVKRPKEVADKINKAKLKPVVMFNDTIELKFDSLQDAALYLGNKNRIGNISSVLLGLRPTAYGYKFKYNEDVDLQDKEPVR